MKKIILFLFSLQFSLLSFASPTSSVIFLDGGALSPRPEEFAFSLDKLGWGGIYDITCTFTSDAKSHQALDVINFYQIAGYDIDDQGFKNFQNVPLPTSGAHIIKLFAIERGDFPLYMRNLDDTDTITLSNCYAVPETKR